MIFSNYKILAFLFITALFFSSCKTAMLYTTLDILRPAQVEFASDVENLLIVNNSTIQPADSGHIMRTFNGDLLKVEVATDSIALFCLSVLAEEMGKTDFFASVDLQLNSVNRNMDFNSIVPLQKAAVKSLCEDYDVDAVLSLDHIVVKDEIQEYLESGGGSFFTNVFAVLSVKYETLWSVHYPDRLRAVTVHFKDSLFWESGANSRTKAFEGLPHRQDAIIDGALLVGQKSVKRFIPYWEKDDRYFFNSNNKLMKQGMDFVYVRKWESAIMLWKEVFNSTNNLKLRAQSANNIAIAHEIAGEYNEALRYAKISFDIFNSRMLIDNDTLLRLSDYIMELYRRQKEIELLNKQLSE